jgi:hypothetical protein
MFQLDITLNVLLNIDNINYGVCLFLFVVKWMYHP